ncbi:hypothetical protein [Myxococcus sp. SDU36]|uniref:hypothetical protein n=1 Tax=Myxococcus sp. SDU36 TaxID=2831967 RepID=UPI00254350DB|nr:hypothetical protein [Myxococcus sp. SDU36]WIG96667.1 hypothetical protein KGD87_04305 [Myxococcus sp. SDU36]
MKKTLARFGLLGLLAGLAGMSYSMPAAAAPKATQQQNLGYYEYEIIITENEIYLIYEYGEFAPVANAAATALNDATFDN